ncbi:MAG: right-handed parallel beta-helix repeat-containing protein [Thermoflexales bacterium]|nr:right-handed parallel beta-helix repeat-containing protein [Thermoflexales bacterium]
MFNNLALQGGGLYLKDSSATLSENIVSTNGVALGGGLFSTSSLITLTANAISTNTADFGGGGLYLHGSRATLVDNAIAANVSSGGDGGGLHLQASSITLTANTITSNTATLGGGGLFEETGDATLINNVIADNQVAPNGLGSGLYVRASLLRLLHTTIARNRGGKSGGLHVTEYPSRYSSMALTNTIMVSHSLGISVTAGNTVTVNGILWHSTPITVSSSPTATVLVQNEHWGDPAFAPDGYHLGSASAAIDRGVDAGVTGAVSHDIDGEPRPQGAGYDLGADEARAGVPVSPTLYLAKTASASTAQPGSTLSYQLVLTVTGGAISVVLTDTLPPGLGYVPGSLSGGASYVDGQIRYAGPVTVGGELRITYQAMVAASVAPGSILYNEAVVSGAGTLLRRGAAVAVASPAFDQSLVLIYAGGDNDLADGMLRLINRAEKAAGNAHALVLLVLDGPGDGDSFLYRLQEDYDDSCPNYANPTCDGRYVEGQTLWRWGEDSGSPYSLAEFLEGALRAYPGARQVILALAGHGGGWTPDLLAGQPSFHDTQPGGLLWDAHPGDSLSTYELGQALRWSRQAGGRKIDLLYLDACLMATSEVAYELRGEADYLLASESVKWASFPYDLHIDAVDGVRTARQLGHAWLQNEADLLRPEGYPFTYALIDLGQVEALQTVRDALATALVATLPISRPQIEAAWTASGCFDSSQDGVIGPEDNLCDLGAFAGQIERSFSDNVTVTAAAQAVPGAVAAAVVTQTYHNGVPWQHPEQTWAWDSLGGLSGYLPLKEDDWKRLYYPSGTWRQFLVQYWNSMPPTCPPDCGPTPAPPQVAGISLRARAGQSTINLDWMLQQPITNLVRYQLYRRADEGSFGLITATLLSQYGDADPAMAEGTDYCYQVRAVDGGGAVTGQSNVACTRFGALTLWISDQAAPPGAANVLVPINLDNGDGVCIEAAGFVVHYDAAIVRATGRVSSTIYTQGYAFQANTQVPGQVKISAVLGQECRPLYGAGSLFQIGFDILGSEGQLSPLDFITGLTGTVIYANDDLDTPVELNLSNGLLIVQSAYVRGDLNGDGVVNPADPRLALRIVAGQLTPTPQQRGACDVNGDGACSTADVSLLLCYATYQDWGVCGSGAGSSLRATHPLRAGALHVQAEPVRLSIDPISGVQGQVVNVPVRIANGSEFAGGEFVFTYDPKALTARGATLTSLTSGFIMTTSAQLGLLRVALAANAPIAGDSVLFNVQLVVEAEAGAALNWGAVRLNDAYGRDLETSALQRDIVLEIGALHDTYALYLPLVVKNPVAPLTPAESLVPYLVKDINQNTDSSRPSDLLALNGSLFFTADDKVHGRELWKSDGTAAGTEVLDIDPGSASSSPHNLIRVGNVLFFLTGYSPDTVRLWRSAGMAAGTVMLAVVPQSTYTDPGCSSYSPALIDVNGTLFFANDDGSHGLELWKSDGTAAGTVQLIDINPGSGASCPSYLAEVNGVLFFTANDGVHGPELWKSDGSAAGTVQVADITPGSAGSFPRELAKVGDVLFFTADDGVHGRELWRSDGTAAGTVQVIDAIPGSTGLSPYDLTEVGDTLFFLTDDLDASPYTTRLWQSDGKAAGTITLAVMLKSIGGPGYSPCLPNLTDVNGTLFFSADDGVHGMELWKSDGTLTGTVVIDIYPGGDPYPSGSYPRHLADVNGTLLFIAGSGGRSELWKSDGSAAGTVMVKILPWSKDYWYKYGEEEQNPSNLIDVGGTLFFVTFDEAHGTELWKSDGTQANTTLVKDINDTQTTSSSPSYLSGMDGSLFFGANDGIHGWELWRSDGTSTDTVMVADICPDCHSSPSGLTPVNGTLFFGAGDGVHGRELWKSDGTPGSTVQVADINPGSASSKPDYLTDVNGTLFFFADDGVHGNELWKSDGATGGITLVADIHPGSDSSFPHYLVSIGGTLFFQLQDGGAGYELWRSDGTPTGTVMVIDNSGPAPGNLIDVDGTLFFSVWDDAHGWELWKSDGTATASVMVKDITPGTESSSPSSLTNVDGTLFFFAGTGLWSSDGTAASTQQVADIHTSDLAYLTNVSGTLFFRARGNAGRWELWKSDGTAAGTVRIADSWPTSVDSNLTHLANVNGVLFFSAWDEIRGGGLWKSDGTAAGTVLVVESGPLPGDLIDVDGTFFFGGWDDVHGSELWALEVPEE